MRIRVVAQNLQHGARADESGTATDRWPALVERLRPLDADILLLTEARGFNRHGRELLGKAQRDLGMCAAPMPPSTNDLPTLLMFRPATMGFWLHCNDDHSAHTAHGFTVVTFSPPEANLPTPISFVPMHLTPYSSTAAVQEAELILTRAYRYGPLAVVGGDVNFSPIGGPDPDYATMRPYNLASRTILGEDGGRRPNRAVAQAFQDRGYVDVAWELFQRTKDQALLRRTANHERIDWLAVSGALAGAVDNYQLLDQPAGASDHHGVAVDIHTDRIGTDGLWVYG